jgi:BirA family biotin operon repressor/biotin-[acetyl-CoA-carboxylase] ligase
MFSLAFKPVYTLEQHIRLSWFSALMWQQCMLRFGLKAHIKWPNDLYVGKQKIGGILIEQQLKGAQLDWSILGCGINVNEVPELEQTTSIFKEINQRFKPLTVLAEYLDLLNGQQHLLYGDFAYLKAKFEAELWLKDSVQVFEKTDGTRFEGRIIGVNDVGEIRIETNGEIAHFANQELRYRSI